MGRTKTTVDVATRNRKLADVTMPPTAVRTRVFPWCCSRACAASARRTLTARREAAPAGADPEYERGAVCNRGERGAGCQTDAACQTGLTCELVFDSMVLETVYRGCSECSSDGDCGPGEVCGLEMSPFEAQRGLRLCQPQGSVLNGGSCTSLDTDGDLACASGRCGPAFAGVLFTLEVCGDCRVDADCPEGQTCSAGAVQDGFVTGPTCTPA